MLLRKMIHLYGTPKFAMTHHPIAIFLGSNETNLLKELLKRTPPWLATFPPKTLNTQATRLITSQKTAS